MTEVATRALKAVRFQKFNIPRRLRPEAVGGHIERIHNEPENPLFASVCHLYTSLDADLLNRVASHNAEQTGFLTLVNRVWKTSRRLDAPRRRACYQWRFRKAALCILVMELDMLLWRGHA